ncbi:MAG: hypothetical protein R3B47_03410 [Bacteroidia bacterium]
MRATVTLLAFLTLLTSATYSQILQNQSIPQTGQERDFLKPPIDHDFIEKGNIKQVVIRDVSYSQRPTGDETLLQFDDEGRLEGQVEIDAQDTSAVLAYGYSASGNLCKEVYENRKWNQCVQRSYRLNRDATFLQGKSYEMQGDRNVMLLDTRRFHYEDGLLAKIYILTEGEVSQIHHFEYDSFKKLTREHTNSKDGTLLFSVDYFYNDKGQLVKVQRVDQMRGNKSEVFTYSYDSAGRLAEAQWLQQDKLRSTFTYSYDERNQLTEIRYETQKGLRRIQGRQLIDYQAYTQEELNELWKSRESQTVTASADRK